MNLSENVRKEQLPQLQKYLSPEDFQLYEELLATNWSGLKVFDEQIYPRMYGYAGKNEYYEAIVLADHVLDIKVPTFALDAEDDQICGGHMLAPIKAAKSEESHIMLAATNYGAHVCHLYGHLVPKPWYPKPCLEFFHFLEARKTLRKKDD